ncbi:unnamed protein product [Effrenium voratum]|uniref:Bromodomain associated domain-containing protein n=1 Tax=Effrenium voratum TaxID=2562239 RepID=A0AA36MQP2_9DINO|nr:unnamed protein product [Effrenium voratum]CAJ1376665.1 unnamed protein product [Effrenium voratum]
MEMTRADEASNALRAAVMRICQQNGFNFAEAAALDGLVAATALYLQDVGCRSRLCAELAARSQVELSDIKAAVSASVGVDMDELEEAGTTPLIWDFQQVHDEEVGVGLGGGTEISSPFAAPEAPSAGSVPEWTTTAQQENLRSGHLSFNWLRRHAQPQQNMLEELAVKAEKKESRAGDIDIEQNNDTQSDISELFDE